MRYHRSSFRFRSAFWDYKLSTLYVVVSTPEFTYPPIKREAYRVHSYVDDGEDKWEVTAVDNEARTYQLRRVHDHSDIRKGARASDIKGEVTSVMRFVDT